MVEELKIKICHLTSAHVRNDIRILVKECKSIAKQNDFDVSLIVADNNGDEINDNIKIYDVGKSKGRMNRFIITSKKVYTKAKELDCDIYHLHDPELIPHGLKLLKLKKKVIFDAHEDLPQQLRSKPYLNIILKKTLPLVFEKYEKFAFKKFSYLIGATPYITNKLKKINSKAVNINNYPIIGELDQNLDWGDKRKEICYIGAISEIRGIKQLVEAMQYVDKDIKLNLVGNFNDNNILESLKQTPGWSKINYTGQVSRLEVSKILARSKVGIVTFLPVPNHTDSQPNKMFEYMSSGIPIVTSHFPLWKEIVEINNVGITVDPNEPKDIAKGIQHLIENGSLAKEMGMNGKNAIKNKYNWYQEEIKLIEVYRKLSELN